MTPTLNEQQALAVNRITQDLITDAKRAVKQFSNSNLATATIKNSPLMRMNLVQQSYDILAVCRQLQQQADTRLNQILSDPMASDTIRIRFNEAWDNIKTNLYCSRQYIYGEEIEAATQGIKNNDYVLDELLSVYLPTLEIPKQDLPTSIAKASSETATTAKLTPYPLPQKYQHRVEYGLYLLLQQQNWIVSDEQTSARDKKNVTIQFDKKLQRKPFYEALVKLLTGIFNGGAIPKFSETVLTIKTQSGKNFIVELNKALMDCCHAYLENFNQRVPKPIGIVGYPITEEDAFQLNYYNLPQFSAPLNASELFTVDYPYDQNYPETMREHLNITDQEVICHYMGTFVERQLENYIETQFGFNIVAKAQRDAMSAEEMPSGYANEQRGEEELEMAFSDAELPGQLPATATVPNQPAMVESQNPAAETLPTNATASASEILRNQLLQSVQRLNNKVDELCRMKQYQESEPLFNQMLLKAVKDEKQQLTQVLTDFNQFAQFDKNFGDNIIDALGADIHQLRLLLAQANYTYQDSDAIKQDIFDQLNHSLMQRAKISLS